MTAADWYATTCPTWCTGTHPTVLAPESDPITYDSPEAQPYQLHSRRLDAAGHGLTTALGHWEHHPHAEPVEHPGPRVFVTLPAHHEDDGASPDTLRAWARVLDAAATEADTWTGADR